VEEPVKEEEKEQPESIWKIPIDFTKKDRVEIKPKPKPLPQKPVEPKVPKASQAAEPEAKPVEEVKTVIEEQVKPEKLSKPEPAAKKSIMD
jgi:hypothetical protein